MSPSKYDNIYTNQINVRIDDLNYGNHLCHSKYINIIHNTRALFLKKYNLSELDCFGSGIVMLNLNIDYLSQCMFNDTLEVSLSIDNLEKATFLLSYSVFNHTTNKLAARASTSMGFLDKKKGKLKRVPVDFIKLIEMEITK